MNIKEAGIGPFKNIQISGVTGLQSCITLYFVTSVHSAPRSVSLSLGDDNSVLDPSTTSIIFDDFIFYIGIFIYQIIFYESFLH